MTGTGKKCNKYEKCLTCEDCEREPEPQLACITCGKSYCWKWMNREVCDACDKKRERVSSNEHHGGAGMIRYGGGRQINSGGSLRGGRFDLR